LRSIEQEVKSIKLRAKRYGHGAEKHKSNEQQLGLNGPGKAQALTTTIRLKPVEKENKTCYWRVNHHAGSKECQSTHAEVMSDQNKYLTLKR
jgi:hypothetical protein